MRIFETLISGGRGELGVLSSQGFVFRFIVTDMSTEKEYLCFSLVLLSTESMNMYNNALVFCSWKSTTLKKEGHLTFEATFDTCSSYLEMHYYLEVTVDFVIWVSVHATPVHNIQLKCIWAGARKASL